MTNTTKPNNYGNFPGYIHRSTEFNRKLREFEESLIHKIPNDYKQYYLNRRTDFSNQWTRLDEPLNIKDLL